MNNVIKTNPRTALVSIATELEINASTIIIGDKPLAISKIDNILSLLRLPFLIKNSFNIGIEIILKASITIESIIPIRIIYHIENKPVLKLIILPK